MDQPDRNNSIKVLFIGPNVAYTVAIQTERVLAMFIMQNVHGHIQVYDYNGNFLFSADSEREARKELEEYAESAA